MIKNSTFCLMQKRQVAMIPQRSPGMQLSRMGNVKRCWNSMELSVLAKQMTIQTISRLKRQTIRLRGHTRSATRYKQKVIKTTLVVVQTIQKKKQLTSNTMTLSKSPFGNLVKVKSMLTLLKP